MKFVTLTFPKVDTKISTRNNIKFNTIIKEDTEMTAVNGTTVKNDFKNICSRVYDGEVIVIARPRNENVVMISEREYAELERLRKNAEYLAKIDRALAQREAGTMQEHEIIEV